jgi:hypothetical protein
MPDLERIGQLTPGTLSQQWYEDGAVVDPGTVTVGITRADGTVLVAAGTATTGSGTGARTYNLTTTHTALLDRLTVTWTSTLKGTLLSYVEVVGGFWFSLAELRAIRGLTDTTDYPTSDLAAMRTTVEDAIEEYTGALVPRYAYQTVSGVSGQPIRLSKPYVGRSGRSPSTGPRCRSVRSLRCDCRAACCRATRGRPGSGTCRSAMSMAATRRRSASVEPRCCSRRCG